SSNVSTYSTNYPSLILDDSEETLFHSNQYATNGFGDVYFKFESSRVINKIEFLTRHPQQNNGCIEQYEILYKNKSFDAGWISIFNSEVDIVKGLREASFDDVLASEICIKVNRSYGNWIVMNNIEFYSSAESENDLLTIFSNLDCNKIKTDIELININYLKDKYKGNVNFENLLTFGKFLWLNKNNITKQSISLTKQIVTSKEFSETLKIEQSGLIKHLGVSIKSKKESMIISNTNFNIYFKKDILSEVERLIEIKVGVNLIYSKDISGDLFVDELKKDISLTVYNASEALYYKVGKNKFKDFFKKEAAEDSKMYIESKSFVACLNYNWVKNNFNNFDFVQSIENLDTILDFTYFLINRNEYFYETPNKRLIYEGDFTDKVVKQGISKVGSFVSLLGMPNLMFNKKIELLANPSLCRILSKELVLKNYFEEDIYNGLTLILSKELEFRYLRVMVLPEDEKRNIWLKLRLFSGDNRFITKIFKKIQKYGLNENEAQIDSLVKWITEILERDISKYFIQTGNSLSVEILEYCNSYPEVGIDLNTINFENYKEFIDNEVKIINTNYKKNKLEA
ncbi:MAG: hypothetical protein ACRC6E_06710, partial [Fusobacteriaceae bacterium]